MTTVYNIDLGIKESEFFNIKNKSLKLDTAEDVSDIIKDIKAVSTLKKVDLSGNTIGPKALEAIVDAILTVSKTNLVELNLQDIFTARNKEEIQESFEKLIPLLPQFTNLLVLNLSDNAIGQEAIGPLCSILAKLPALKHLILTNNGLGPFSGAKLGKALYAQSKISTNGGLQTFWCGRNRLEKGSIDYLSIGLRQHPELKEIRMYQNGIRPAGISKFIKHCISQLTNLQVLDLQDNTFTVVGATALAGTVDKLADLKELNLNDCFLDKRGGLTLVQALGGLKDSKLESLKLQFNELDEPVLELLARTVPVLSDLKFLDLNGNIFFEDSEHIEKINEHFESKGFGELGELDELEEPDSEEEDEEGEEEEKEDNINLDALEKDLASVHI
ncbi:unnamed protein product [Ambrosiozyma monospora]|uniref:Unnamed protein product n=1 Tax=Ambrosiozyma monospora TaxID=43982 RepID=A0ACB5T5A9_AMBMO|nr:unnamed protein product [Ambrosiozyma monospora]